jgi:hypothetical protein
VSSNLSITGMSSPAVGLTGEPRHSRGPSFPSLLARHPNLGVAAVKYIPPGDAIQPPAEPALAVLAFLHSFLKFSVSVTSCKRT